MKTGKKNISRILLMNCCTTVKSTILPRIGVDEDYKDGQANNVLPEAMMRTAI
jgi:hypothetical protein